MYLIEGTTNQYHQTKIYSLRKTSYPDVFIINSTIRPLHTNITPKLPAKTIVYSTHFHTPATTTVYPSSPVYQRLQRQFQPVITDCKHISDNTTADTPLLAKNECDLSKLLPLLNNLTLKDDTLIALKAYTMKLL